MHANFNQNLSKINSNAAEKLVFHDALHPALIAVKYFFHHIILYAQPL